MEDKPNSSFISLSVFQTALGESRPRFFPCLCSWLRLLIFLKTESCSCFDSSVKFCRGSECRSAGVDQFLSLSEALSLSTVDFPPSFKHNDEPLQSCETQASLITFVSKWTPNKPTSLCWLLSRVWPVLMGVSSAGGGQRNLASSHSLELKLINWGSGEHLGSSQHCLTVTGLLNR